MSVKPPGKVKLSKSAISEAGRELVAWLHFERPDLGIDAAEHHLSVISQVVPTPHRDGWDENNPLEALIMRRPWGRLQC